LPYATQVKVPGRPRFFAPLGELEGKFEQPFRGLAGNDERLAGIVMGDDALPHRGEQALGRLPDHDEIDALLVAPTIGLGTPGISRAGRTPA